MALRATQNSGLAFSSDRRAPDHSRQSADGCALWSRLETRYLRLPSPLRHNIFRQTRAPFGPHSDEDLRWRPGAPQACHFASVIGNNLSIGNPQAASAGRQPLGSLECPAPEIRYIIVIDGHRRCSTANHVGGWDDSRMASRGRPKAELVLTEEERETLTRWARRRKSSQALALRSRIVLGCAEGLSNKEVAARERVAQPTVGKWRRRFVEARCDGLVDDPRPGRPASVTAEQVEDVVVATLESAPANATHWSRKSMAERCGLSKSTIGRIWKAFELQPHRSEDFKLSNDPLFVEKVYDIVGLYLDPPEAAVVLCVDEKSQIQALARSQPAFPMMPGMPEKRTHDYVRSGTTSLFAAFDISDGTVITALHRRHRAIEFRKFLATIDAQVPDHLDVHLVCDNYGTHKAPTVQSWLANHPRVHMHYTPTYSSWINQVERWFAELTRQLIERGDHRSVQALERDIRAWVAAWNDKPIPFVWTKTAEQILQSIQRLMKRINGAGH